MADQQRPDDYYDEEARIYSEKRYPTVARNYVHFLFTRRRMLALGLLAKAIADTKEPRTLLEVGCADGILLRSIAHEYPAAFESMLGVDISAPMVDAARTITKDTSISYAVREALPPAGLYSVVMEIGVAALILDANKESTILADQLEGGGYLLCSVAGSTSLASLFSRGTSGDSALQPYKVYEKVLFKKFELVAVQSYGIYLPLLWHAPALARMVQPIAEIIGKFLPNLCHEHLYLLKKI